MYIVRGLTPRPSCSFRLCQFSHISTVTSTALFSERFNAHNDRTPHRGAAFSSVKCPTWCQTPDQGATFQPLGVDVRRQGADVTQVAVLLGVVETVTDHE